MPVREGATLGGRFVVGAPRGAAPGFSAWDLVDTSAPAAELELVLPKGHLQLRAGARNDWELARQLRSTCAGAALTDVGSVDVDGWPALVRPASAPLALDAGSDAERSALAGWLLASGVDLNAAAASDLVVLTDGSPRFAPLGLREHALVRTPLAQLLGTPLGSTAPRWPTAAALAARPSALATGGALPAAALVATIPDDPVRQRRIALRTGVALRAVERAAQRPGTWLWAPVPTPEAAPRLRAQAGAAGLSVELTSTSAPAPSFLPAVVFGGLAQVPSFVSTGIAGLDTAVLAGLGLTAVVSFTRAARRVGPARRAASAAGAWEAWRRADRSAGPELLLLALEARAPTLPEVVRTDVNGALDAAWTRRFQLADQGDPSAALTRLARDLQAVSDLLGAPEGPELVRALRQLA